jgi:prepilin-type N-terminal cleavage/methylation domain-containing protein/prepilin-type processing-associated H-X9-DG protein
MPVWSRTGFTLIELLVVIGVIGVLVAILLPALGRARVAAQTTQCLSNLRQIGAATLMYRNETGRLPLYIVMRSFPDGTPPNADGGIAMARPGYMHGGMSTHDQLQSFYKLSEGEKPLTKYVYKNVNEDWQIPAANQRPPRDVFRCPADDSEGALPGSFGWNSGVPGVISPYVAYGTSYYVNAGWLEDKAISPRWGDIVFSPDSSAESYMSKVPWFNKTVAREISKWRASRTYLMGDIWFHISLRDRVRLKGWHGGFSRHNVLFMDGHARPVTVVEADFARPPGFPSGNYPRRGRDDWSEYNDKR